GVVKLSSSRPGPIRVDRDRRPDSGMRYQAAVGAAFPKEGGWPLTAFLFDTGDLFFGSSVVSLRDRRDRLGLTTMLSRAADFYAAKKEEAAGTREVVELAFKREQAAVRAPEYALPYLEAILKDAITEIDKEHGG